MKLTITTLIIALALPLGVSAAGNNANFPTGDARYQAETADTRQPVATAKNYRVSTANPIKAAPTGKQHSLRDPYGDPALIKRDIFR